MLTWEENNGDRLRIDYRINKLSCFLFTISLFVCAWIVWSYRNLFHLVLEIEVKYIVVLVALFMIVQLVNGYKVFMIVRFFGSRMRTIDWIGLPYLTSYLNYFPANAGTGVTALFLKKRYELPYTKFASISGTLLLLQLFCLSTIWGNWQYPSQSQQLGFNSFFWPGLHAAWSRHLALRYLLFP